MTIILAVLNHKMKLFYLLTYSCLAVNTSNNGIETQTNDRLEGKY